MDAEFQKYNILRSPSWRWDRVMELTSSARPRRCSWKRDDHFVREAKQFHVDYHRLDGNERNALNVENPGLFCAYQLHHDADEFYSCALQAHLLTGRPFQQIADSIGCLTSTVHWYEALFFNVADRVQDKRKARDWVVRQILGPAASKGVAERDFDVTAKLFAYFCGVEALNVVLHHLIDLRGPSSVTDTPRFLDDVMGFGLRRKSAIASLTFDVNKFNVMQLFDTHAKLIELEVTKQQNAGPTGDFEKQVTALLSEVEGRWTVGAEAKEMWQDNPLGIFHGQAAELRADEAMLVASGNAPAELYNEVSQLRLPPPRRKINENAE